MFADLFRGGLTGRGAGPSRVADGVRGASDAYPFPQKKRLHKRRLRPSHPPGLPLCSLVEVRPRRSDGKRTVRPRRSRRQAVLPSSQLLAAPRPPPAPFSACSLRVRGPLGQRRRARAAGRLQRVVGRDNAPRSPPTACFSRHPRQPFPAGVRLSWYASGPAGTRRIAALPRRLPPGLTQPCAG